MSRGTLRHRYDSSAESTPLTAVSYPLVRGAGTVTATERDPFEILDNLMAVIEGLCPQWPPRGVFVGKYIL